MRACSMCGEKGRSNTWVLIAVMWPEEHRKGETLGIALCEKHYEVFHKALAEYKPVIV